MIWLGWMEFLRMGGHALHVWGSYLVVPVLVLLEVVLLLIRKREIYGHLGWRASAGRPIEGSRQAHAGVRPEQVDGQSGERLMVRHHERRCRHHERRSEQHERRSLHHEQIIPQIERRSPHNERRSPHNERRSPHSERRSGAGIPSPQIEIAAFPERPARPGYLD